MSNFDASLAAKESLEEFLKLDRDESIGNPYNEQDRKDVALFLLHKIATNCERIANALIAANGLSESEVDKMAGTSTIQKTTIGGAP